jgi:MtaA/CmuA family methyltransferase
MTGRERILAMLNGRQPDRLPLMPITMMFASDQIGSNYREYATDHHVLADAQIETAGKFAFDYVSVISDPAREASDLGANIEWFENQPPAIIEEHALLLDKTRLAKMDVPDPHASPRMNDRVQGVALLRSRAGGEKLVEGWVEGPCAMGADLRGINNLMLDFHDDPAFVQDLFEFVVAMELGFASAQIDAGADLIGVGDAAASLVGPKIYDEFVWPYEKRLIEGLHAMGVKVRLHICGNTKRILSGMGKLGADMVDLDFLSPVALGREKMGPTQVIAGNMDPVKLMRDGTPQQVCEAVAQCHREAGEHYIAGAGCEIPRGTPPANLLALLDYVKSAPVRLLGSTADHLPK